MGKQLADKLDRSDVLGRWMSHHIAELIARAESAPVEQEPAASHAAAEAITSLWGNRDGAPWGRRPLRNFQPIFAALERLTETTSPWAFYRTFDEDSQPSDEETSSHAVLAAACELESQMHRIVRSAIALAAREAEAQEAAWVAVGLEIADDDESRAIKVLQRLQWHAEFRRANYDERHDEQADEQDEYSGLSDTETDPVLATLTAALDSAASAIRELANRLPPANMTTAPSGNSDSSD